MTKLSAVRLAIEKFEQERRMVSHNGLSALKGNEKRFDELNEALDCLREVAQGLQAEPVRQALADWQRDLMDGKEPSMKF